MNKVKIELNELNKLYDEIYYTSLDGIEQALEIISNIIAEKEFEDQGEDISDFSDMIDTIINVMDEAAEVMDSEELYDVSNYIKEKADRIHTGELDDIIESSYLGCDDEDYDDYDEEDGEDSYDIIDEEYDESEDYDDY